MTLPLRVERVERVDTLSTYVRKCQREDDKNIGGYGAYPPFPPFPPSAPTVTARCGGERTIKYYRIFNRLEHSGIKYREILRRLVRPWQDGGSVAPSVPLVANCDGLLWLSGPWQQRSAASREARWKPGATEIDQAVALWLSGPWQQRSAASREARWKPGPTEIDQAVALRAIAVGADVFRRRCRNPTARGQGITAIDRYGSVAPSVPPVANPVATRNEARETLGKPWLSDDSGTGLLVRSRSAAARASPRSTRLVQVASLAARLGLPASGARRGGPAVTRARRGVPRFSRRAPTPRLCRCAFRPSGELIRAKSEARTARRGCGDRSGREGRR